eukprot:gene9805-9963_t
MQPIGSLAVLNSTVDPTYDDSRSRPTQAQTFQHKATGAKFTYVIAHLKSKGSPCTPADPDVGDGQGNCAQTRAAAARAIVNWLARDPTGSGDPDYIVMGDLNAYAMEDAIRAFTDSGYTNLIKQYMGSEAYSYVFDGRQGYLDHALATASMTNQSVNAYEWHINAAEPGEFNYSMKDKSANQITEWYTPAPVRFSDHDPVMVDLVLNGQ